MPSLTTRADRIAERARALPPLAVEAVIVAGCLAISEGTPTETDQTPTPEPVPATR